MSTLLVAEGMLALLGAFIGLSIAYISLIGYRETGSPALLRLTSAFILLFLGFTCEALAVFGYVGVLPILALATAFFTIASSFLETLGFFFLAFSYILNVRATQRVSVMPLILPLSLPVIQISAALKSISFYLLIYAAVETAISYMKTRRAETLVLSLGLIFLAVSELIRWISYVELSWPFWYSTSLVLKLIGFSALLAPIVKFASLKGGVLKNGV
ncbi:MAG: hypothetical protein HA494_03685 [Thaumarchaeota archaeon]|nr:hypothetical protein [Nitrososphaerota archaeon]